jgi:hypothetical protein
MCDTTAMVTGYGMMVCLLGFVLLVGVSEGAKVLGYAPGVPPPDQLYTQEQCRALVRHEPLVPAGIARGVSDAQP